MNQQNDSPEPSGDGSDSNRDAKGPRPPRDQARAASTPLLVLGAVIAVREIIVMSNPTGMPSQDNWASSVLVIIAFGLLWLAYRRRPRGSRPGFGAAAVVGVVLLIAGAAAIVVLGPFLVFGVGLLIAGIVQRNAYLIWPAIVIGGIGVFEGLFGITNRLPASMWRSWEHPAIFLLLGLATIATGVAARLRAEPGAGLSLVRPRS
jgi:hypothetical protein